MPSHSLEWYYSQNVGNFFMLVKSCHLDGFVQVQPIVIFNL